MHFLYIVKINLRMLRIISHLPQIKSIFLEHIHTREISGLPGKVTPQISKDILQLFLYLIKFLL